MRVESRAVRKAFTKPRKDGSDCLGARLRDGSPPFPREPFIRWRGQSIDADGTRLTWFANTLPAEHGSFRFAKRGSTTGGFSACCAESARNVEVREP